VKEKKSLQYLDFMLEQVVNPHFIVNELSDSASGSNLPDNIAPIPPPSKDLAVAHHMTRFSRK
jgi:hypothetical protein